MKDDISPREIEAIRLKCTGLLNKEIADQMNVSHLTVQSHFEHVYEKLKIHNEIQLYNWYLNHKNHEIKRA